MQLLGVYSSLGLLYLVDPIESRDHQIGFCSFKQTSCCQFKIFRILMFEGCIQDLAE